MPILTVNGRLLSAAGVLLTAATSTNSNALTVTPYAISIPVGFINGYFGSVLASGGLGAYTYSLVSAAGSVVVYTINSTTGVIALNVPGTAPSVGQVDVCNVTVTDSSGAIATTTCTVTWLASTANVIIPKAQFAFYNSSAVGSGNFVPFQASGNGYTGSASFVIADVTGNFSTAQPYMYCHAAHWPAPGSYPVSITATQGSNSFTEAMSVLVLNDPGISTLTWSQTTVPLSASRAGGTVVGQILAPGSPVQTTYAIATTGAYQKYSINGFTGVISVAGGLTNSPLSAGVDSVTVVATRNGVSFSTTLTIPVVAGTTLPASNMTMTVATNLTNFVQVSSTPRLVGTPTVTGITGTPIWSIDQNQRCLADEQGTTANGYHATARYIVNASSGQVNAVAQLSAQTDTLTLSVTDGINTCTQQFPVVVAAHVGPTIYIGQGCSTTYPNTLTGGVQGFEHIGDFYLLMQNPNPTYAGATVYIQSNSDINYYANDIVNTLGYMPNGANGYTARYGWHGPVTFIGVQGSGGVRPRLGGIWQSAAFGGCESKQKGCFLQSDGDFTVQNIEFSDVHANYYQGGGFPGSTGTGAAIRMNGTTWGNLTITGCYIHRCDQGVETGINAALVTITNTVVAMSGGCYVGSGATHNLYLGNTAEVVINGLITYGALNGHDFKCRAYNGTYSNCFFGDTERGSASNNVDLPDGGTHVFTNCFIHRGPQPQNPNSVEFCEGLTTPVASASLTMNNCTFINNCPPGYAGGLLGISAYGRCLTLNGVYTSVTVNNPTILGYTSANFAANPFYVNASQSLNATSVTDGRNIAPTITGATYITQQPALSPYLVDPVTNAAIPHEPQFYVIYDGESEVHWLNYYCFNMDFGADDLLVSSSASPVGTVLFTPVVEPSTYSELATGYANPFASGGTWSFATGSGYTTAPAGRYLINASTGAVSVGTTLPTSGVDNVILLCTATNGTKSQQGFYIALAA